MILWAGGLHVIEYKDIVDRFPIPAVGAEITLVPGLAAVRTEPFGIPGQGRGDHKHQSRRCGGLDYIFIIFLLAIAVFYCIGNKRNCVCKLCDIDHYLADHHECRIDLILGNRIVKQGPVGNGGFELGIGGSNLL